MDNGTPTQTPLARPSLKWNEAGGPPQTFALNCERVVIGRRNDADVVLTHRLVSRQHASIVRENDVWIVIDLQSTHGTFVNGTRMSRQELKPNDRIRLGEHGIELVFVIEPSGDAPPSTLLESAALDAPLRKLAGVLPGQPHALSELEKISCLLDLHYNFGKAFSAEKTFQQILKSALDISGAERGFVLSRRKTEFVYALGLDSLGAPLAPDAFHASTSVVDQVMRTAEPVFMTQGIHGELAAQASIVAMNLRAVACLPLEGIQQNSTEPAILGILYLDSRKYMHSLTGLDKKLLTRLAGEAGSVLEKLGMIEAMAERRRIEHELRLAEETQRTLLPQCLPSFHPLAIRAFCRPTRELGGDFYDFIRLQGELACVLADVAGKGIPAALLSSLALGAINMEFRSTSNPSAVLEAVNRLLCQKTPSNRFVTLFLCQLDASGEGCYISAGQPALVYRRARSEIERLESGCMPLGIMPQASYDAQPLTLNPGDILAAYSDGLIDAENDCGEDFGEERLNELFRSAAAAGTIELEAALLESLLRFTRGAQQTDDMTFLLIENMEAAYAAS